MAWFFSRLLRPMVTVERCLFVDRVTGDSVGLYRDAAGKHWLALSPRSLFRVASARMK